MWLTLLVSWTVAQNPAGPVEPWREGPLQNETVLATQAAAEEEIERGDRAWSGADELGAFEAWRHALEVSATGDAVTLVSSDPKAARPWPDEERTAERRTEGVEYAVLRRLEAVGTERRAAWRARFSAAAELALARAQEDAHWLARVEREWPLTEAAARAALVLADAALETDDAEGAAAWLERARRHAREVSPELALAVERRSTALAALTALTAGRASTETRTETWTSARSLVPTGSLRLAGRRASARSPWELPLGRTIEPGWTFLDDGSLVILAPLMLVRVAADGKTERFPTWPTLGLTDDLQPYFSPASAGWPLCATSDGTRCYWVEGRSNEDHDNALAAVSFTRSGEPRVSWLLTSEGLSGADVPGKVARETLLGPGHWALQPGPELAGRRLFVQARQWGEATEEGASTSERLMLCCFDSRTGDLRWKSTLGRPSDLVPEIGRRPAASAFTATPGMPLVRAGSRIFVGTNAGFAALVDAVDGRLAWAFKNRRREATDTGWPGTRRPRVETTAGGTKIVHWAPFDSDVAYALRAEPDLGAGVLAQTPRRRGEALDLVAASGERRLELASVNERRALLDSTGGTSISSVFLGRAEHFTGAGLASSERALVASDRKLYMYDRTRELYLQSALPLEDAEGTLGGSVFARGSKVWVLGPDTLWSFEAR
jgi:hypothetical protein